MLALYNSILPIKKIWKHNSNNTFRVFAPSVAYHQNKEIEALLLPDEYNRRLPNKAPPVNGGGRGDTGGYMNFQPQFIVYAVLFILAVFWTSVIVWYIRARRR